MGADEFNEGRERRKEADEGRVVSGLLGVKT